MNIIEDIRYGILDHIWLGLPCSVWDWYIAILLTINVCMAVLFIIKVATLNNCNTKPEVENRLFKLFLLAVFNVFLAMSIRYVVDIHSEGYNTYIQEKNVQDSTSLPTSKQ